MIDLIHDVGEAYRELVKANSYPGKVCNVAPYVKKSIEMSAMFSATQLLSFMLLDTEVSFTVIGENQPDDIAFITKFTYAKQATIDQADFVFILKTARTEEKQAAIKRAKSGTLIDPHESATIICEVESVTEGDRLYFNGPGIKGTTAVKVTVFDEWQVLLLEKNKEFPLGIEFYLVDEHKDIMALTRTTRVKGCED
jgi:alpha-D-ribose 1-methylphosphonate 5-triphosphate synthase subunit PhnH